MRHGIFSTDATPAWFFSDTALVWWNAVRQKDSIETQKLYLRQARAIFPPRAKVEAGILCAAPEGPASASPSTTESGTS